MSDAPGPRAESTHALVRASRPLVAQSVRATVLTGPDAGRTVVLEQRKAVVGRSSTADLALTDATVSAFHVELSATEHGIDVRDLGSRNGTLFAGVRLAQATVPPGTELALGQTVVRLELGGGFEAAASSTQAFGELRGVSGSMRELFSLLERIARTDLGVLVEGPTGTGKDLVARAVHAGSRHAAGPFIVLDCTAIPATLAESVLFGHEKGAFTGATERRPGVFEAADGGTLFLDEVGELAPEIQPKLLRALERREIVRVGSTQPRAVRVRVIAATLRDLRAMTNAGTFREDLYHRLAQARVAVPALRERPEDVPTLVHHFLQALPRDVPCARAVMPDALAELKRGQYPGNVRELRNVVERAAMLAETGAITLSDLAMQRLISSELAAPEPARPSAPPPPPDGALPAYRDAKRTVLEEFERQYLQRLLARAGDNVSRAATLSRMDRHQVRDLLRKHGLRGDDG